MIELLILGFVTLSVICLWILIERRKDPKFLIWFIPTLLVLVTSTYLTHETLLGYARNGTPEKSIHISHWIDEPSTIYLWVLEDNYRPRAYKFRYTREMHDALQGIDKIRAKGENVVIQGEMEFGDGDDDGGEKKEKVSTLGGGLEYYNWNHLHETPRKN